MLTVFLPTALVDPTLFVLAAQDPPKAKVELHAVLHAFATLGGSSIEQLAREEARKQPTPAEAVRALLQKCGQSPEPEVVAKVENRSIAGPGRQVPIRSYTSSGNGPFPVVLYIHGGSWVMADRFESAGVTMDPQNYAGATRECFGMGGVVSKSRNATQFSRKNFQKAFRNTPVLHGQPNEQEKP